jgi:hypothetical protein
LEPSLDITSLAQSYTKLEALALPLMSDADKVRWFQERAVSAEEANRQLNLVNAQTAILTKFPKADAEDLVGARSIPEMESMAQRAHAKAERVESKTKTTVETDIDAKIAEALKGKDEELEGIRKVLGRPRQPQAADVEVAQTAEQNKALGVGPEKKVELGTIAAVGEVAANAMKRLGLFQGEDE